MKYRSDIAGLRAVAVLPILLFHAGASFLVGGFVGVDVFFVISGYLITSIIHREISNDTFSMMDFYRKRTARIIPALICVILATLIAGAFLMLPPEIELLSLSAASAAVFVSNFYFLFSADYFASAAETLPLLHTWSLAVEEQFYIFFPIILLILNRVKLISAKAAVAIISIVSFAAACLLAKIKPEAAFYLIPARGWELGIGAFIALKGFPEIKNKRAKDFLSVLGVFLIIFSLFSIEPGDLFPAPLALLPCIGTGLLIAYGENSLTSSFLSIKPLRYIGDISYSLYLWHWPIITFYRLKTGIELDLIEMLMLILICFCVASASYHWIEKPFLSILRPTTSDSGKTFGISSVKVVIYGFFALLLTLGVAISIPKISSKIIDLPEKALIYSSLVNYRQTDDYLYQYRRDVCFLGSSGYQEYDWDCLKTSNLKQNIIVLGDSHGAQYWRAISEKYKDYNVIQATNSGCRPLLNLIGEEICTNVVNYVFEKLLEDSSVSLVVLSARWRESEVNNHLADTIRYIQGKGKKVVVIGPTVEYDMDFPLLMARFSINEDFSQIHKHILMDRKVLDEKMAPLVRREGAIYISSFSLECPRIDSCYLLDREENLPYHFDYGHLTLQASRELVSKMNFFD